jgi:hypothetical protein
MKFKIIIGLKHHDWWEWLPATIKGSPNRVNRGWKPLPQPIWLKLTFLLFLGSAEVSVSIKMAAFQTSCWTDT